jgi:hypothetical protein
MFTPLSARLLLRVCLPIVFWTTPFPSAAAPAAPGVLSRKAGSVPDNIDRLIRGTYSNAGVTGIPPAFALIAAATIDLHSGYEWDLQRAAGSAPDLSPCCVPGVSSTAIDFRADSGNWFLLERNRAAEIARLNGGIGSCARPLSHGESGSRMRIMNPKEAAGRWLRISRPDIEDLDVIGWNTSGMAPRAEQLTLCFIGLLGMAPSILRRRGLMGGKDTGRRRSIPIGSYFIN